MNRLRMVVLWACAALAAVLRANAQPVTTIYSFTQGPATPLAGLSLGPDGNFYGTADAGGAGDRGTAFKITTNGTLTTLVDFGGLVSGEYPQANLMLGSDGNFYGTTSQGGTNMSGNNATGTVFKMTTNGTVTTLVNFNGLNGGIPLAGLALAPDGYYYGTTEYGGTNGDGTVFKMTTNGILTTLVSFNGTNGLNPVAGLAVGPGGTLYGTTRNGGGTNGFGTVFAVTTNGTFHTVLQFGGTNGAEPYGGVTVGPDGNLYGTTAFAGNLNGDFSGGSVFELTTNGVVTTLVSFADFSGTNGANPYAGLTLGPDGNFYGTTYAGGTHGNGTVFQVSTNGTLAMLQRIPGIQIQTIYNSLGYEYYTTNDFNTIARVYNGTLTMLYSFTAQTNFINADGAQPQATVAFGPDDLVYGTASSGGTNGYGTVFKVTTNGAFSTLASFSGNNGDNPLNALTVGPNGNFYGTANSGGNGGYGTVFKLTPGGSITTLVNFDRANDGANPQAGLTLGPGGNFYGTAVGGGSNLVYVGSNTYDAVSDGTVFELTTNGIFTALVDFSGTNGANPYGGLAVGLDGNLYGTTAYGGISNDGTIFLLQTNGTLTTLTNFIGANGASPFASMTLGLDGNFYGTCLSGGTNGDGTVFQVTTNGRLKTLVNFNGTNGASPNDSLLLGPDGNFYGTAFSGGAGNGGTVFKVTPGGTLTTLVSFAVTNGDFPVGGLALGPDGYFYGTTETGGVLGNAGTVFKLSTNGTLTTLYDFVYSAKSPNGNYPFATLTLATNGSFIHFYGSTYNGGSGGGGTVFQLNLTTAYAVPENSTNTFYPLTNDVLWTTGGTLDLVSATVTNGTAQISGTGIVFTPAANFTGTATINYAVTNNAGGTNNSLITVLVTNIPPVANPDFYTVAENSSGNVLSPLTNDMPVTSGGMLSLVSVSPTNGTAAISGTNVLFTPQANFVGTATIGYTITDNIGGTNSSLITVTIVNLSADLSLNASAAPEPVGLGSNLVYSITVSNAGPSTATGVMVSNQIPVNVIFVSASGGAAPSGGILLLNLGSLAAGAADSVQIIVQPATAGQLTNLFQVYGSLADPVPSNNAATVLSTVTGVALANGNFYDEFNLGPSNAPAAVNSFGQIAGVMGNEFPVFLTNYAAQPFKMNALIPGGKGGCDKINDAGQIVGRADTSQNIAHAVYWTNYQSLPVDLEILGGPVNTNEESEAYAINATGQIVGRAYFTNELVGHAAYWSGSTSAGVDLGALGGSTNDSYAYSVNGSGQIVGFSRDGSNQRAVYWANGRSVPQDLGTLGGSEAAAYSINDAGEIVGAAQIANGQWQAAYWTNANSPAVALAPFCSAPTNIAVAINNAGQIEGLAYNGLTNVYGFTPVIWRNPGSLPLDLNTLVVSNLGYQLVQPTEFTVAMSDSGEILLPGIANGSLSAVAYLALLPTSATITPSADLSLTASAAPDPVGVGNNLVYSITVSNAGPMGASGVVISNQLPANASFVSATGGATPLGGTLTFDPCSLAAGAALQFQVVVQPTVPGQLTNVFSVSSDVTDPVPSNNFATVVTTVTNVAPETADLSITATAAPTLVVTVVPADYQVVTNFITVSNAGPATATGVVVSNQLPAGITFDSATGGATPEGNVLLINAGTLAAGASISLQVLETPTNGILYTNVFTVSGSQPDPVPANNSATDTFSGEGLPATSFTDSTLSFTDNIPSAANAQATNFTTVLVAKMPNGTVVYSNTFTTTFSDPSVQAAVVLAAEDLTNSGASGYTGPAETGSGQGLQGVNSVSVTNLIGTNFTTVVTEYVGPTNIFVGPNRSEELTLAPGQDDVDTLVTFFETNDVVTTNTSLYTNSSVYVMTGIVPQATVELSITANGLPNPVGVGSNLTYSITVSNATPNFQPNDSHLEPAPATDVTISNRIPAGVTFVSATGGATPGSGLLLMNLGSLSAGATASAQVVVKPTVAGQLTNWFAVFADQSNSTPANGLVMTVNTVTNETPPTVDVALGMTAVPAPVEAGTPLTYSLTVTNNSVATAPGVVVSNTLPANVTLNSVLPSVGSYTTSGREVTVLLGSLANGTEDSIAIVVIPNAAGQLTNEATVYSTQTDSVPANNSATNITTAVAVPITNLVLTVLSGITLNPQTGLFQEQVKVFNGGPTTPASVLVLISGLGGNITLYNATGTTNGTPYVQSPGPLGVGSNIVFLLEYYSPTRTTPHPTLTAVAGPAVNPPVITGTVMGISRTVGLSNGDVLVEFATIPGRIYAVQYSSDLSNWQTALPVITAPANRVQWIDAGPPGTASSPATAPARYYRVVLLP